MSVVARKCQAQCGQLRAAWRRAKEVMAKSMVVYLRLIALEEDNWSPPPLFRPSLLKASGTFREPDGMQA